MLSGGVNIMVSVKYRMVDLSSWFPAEETMDNASCAFKVMLNNLAESILCSS
jgi:hypothetical protein